MHSLLLLSVPDDRFNDSSMDRGAANSSLVYSLLGQSAEIMFSFQQGSIHSVYRRYPEGLGEVLHREQFDFNAEPPWDPS